MKIVNRQIFLAMPAGTIYSKYVPCMFGDLYIKGDSLTSDWYEQAIVDAIAHDDSTEFHDKLIHAEKYGDSLVMDFDCEQRHGLFDADQLFAVWERDDVEQLITRLQKTLK